MSEERKKSSKNIIQTVVSFVSFIVFGLLCGVLIAQYLVAVDGFDVSFGVFLIKLGVALLGVYALLFLQIILHEAGHLIFGLMSGYRFTAFRIANIMLIKNNGKIHLRKFSLAGTGGQCLMAPPDLVDGKIPYILYNLGGVLLNLGSAVLVFPLILIFDMPLFMLILSIFALSGVLLAFTNGVPMKGLVDNDGQNIRTLNRFPEDIQYFWIQMKIHHLMTEGSRLKDLPEEWFYEISPVDMGNSLKSYLGVSTANRYMEKGDFDKAVNLINSYISPASHLQGLYRNLLVCDKICCDFILSGESDLSLLTKDQKKIMKAMKTFPSVIRTEYALALFADNDLDKAEKIKENFETVKKSYPYASDIEGEEELMEVIKEVFSKINSN